MNLVSEKILNALLNGLSIKDLETILKQKKEKVSPKHKLNPMTKRKKLKNHYRSLLLSRGNLHLPNPNKQ